VSRTGRRVLGWFGAHMAELRLAVRVVVAGVATFALARLLGLAQGYWAVFTAVIVMQASVGGSLKASFDRLVGTVGGAMYGGALAAVIPHGTAAGLAALLALVLGPLALLAAIDVRFRVAPVTAVILLLAPVGPDVTPLALVVDRILEIALGGIVAVTVSLVVLPARAHYLLAEAAGRLLNLFADFLPLLLGGLADQPDPLAVAKAQASTRKALAALDAAADESRRERDIHLTDEPDPDPVVRTAQRLRNDFTMIARAVSGPLPEPILARVGGHLGRIGIEGGAVLRGTAAAFAARASPPSLDRLEAVLTAFSGEIAGIRRERLTQDLPTEAVGRLFALDFALSQFHQDLSDMTARCREFAVALPPP
jgi:hypothetical protein